MPFLAAAGVGHHDAFNIDADEILDDVVGIAIDDCAG